MTTKNSIILTPEPRGRIRDVKVSGALLPGTIVQLTNAEPVNGIYTWGVYNRDADGNRPIGGYAILLENYRGGDPTTAYVTGEQGRVYFPIPGDELLLLVANITGTGDTFAIGDLLIVDDGTGKGIATTGSPESEPFTVIETISTALTADTLVEVMYTGY